MTDFRFGVVGVVPFWSRSDNLNVDSNYTYMRIVLPEMVRQTTDTIFLVFFPNPRYGRGKWVYTPDGLQSDRIRFIKWNYDTSMRAGVLAFDPERFSEIDEKFAPVTYWAHQVESAVWLAGGYRQSFNPSSRPSLVAHHRYVIHDSLPYNVDGLFPRLWTQMGGTIAADRVIFNSIYTRRMARESFSKYVSPSRYAEIDRKSTTVPHGLVNDDDPIAPVATADDKPAMVYNHRFQAFKRPQNTFATFDSLRDRFDFDVLVFQPPRTIKTGGRRQYHYDRVIWKPDHNDYLSALARPGINTINTQYETFCNAIMDSISVGQLVVVPDGLTFRELLPDDYPYFYKTDNEQREMLAFILSSWPDEFNNWRLPLATHARDNFNVRDYAARCLDILAETEQTYRDHKPKPQTMEMMTKTWDSMRPGVGYEPAELRRQMGRLKIRAVGDQAFSSRRIIRDSLMFRDDIGVRWENRGVRLYRRT